MRVSPPLLDLPLERSHESQLPTCASPGNSSTSPSLVELEGEHEARVVRVGVELQRELPGVAEPVVVDPPPVRLVARSSARWKKASFCASASSTRKNGSNGCAAGLLAFGERLGRGEEALMRAAAAAPARTPRCAACSGRCA